MNDSNLIPLNKRTKAEQREITRKAGIKSGEARRRNRDIKKIIAELLKAAPEDAATVERLKALGIKDTDITNKTVMVLSMFEAAKAGNVKAFETLMKYSGEDPEQQRKEAELQIKRELLQMKKADFHEENDYEDLTILADLLKLEDDEAANP